VETARRQAVRRGHPLEREAALLLIHGILHLVGYDHATPGARRRMWREQARLLRAAVAGRRGAGRARRRA
jgi:probable rRNA maturation factor